MQCFSPDSDKYAEIIEKCIFALENHGVILLPTETVYGLVCRFEDNIAEEKIYQLKHRPAEKRLSVFVDKPEKLESYGVEFSPLVKELADTYCPAQ